MACFYAEGEAQKIKKRPFRDVSLWSTSTKLPYSPATPTLVPLGEIKAM